MINQSKNIGILIAGCLAAFFVGRLTAPSPDPDGILQLEKRIEHQVATADSLNRAADAHREATTHYIYRAQLLEDSLRGAQEMALKLKQKYEQTLAHPVVLRSDAQRDSILTELYGKN